MTSTLGLIALIALPYVAFAITLYLSSQGYPVWVNRKIIHIVGIFAAALYASVLPLNEVLIVFGVVFGLLFLLSIPPIRLAQRLFSMGTREGEETSTLYINNILTYGTLLIIYLITFNYRYIFLTAAFAVSLGDGLGEVIGRPFGKVTYTIFGQKSLEGSLGVFIGTFAGAILSFSIFNLVIAASILLLLLTSFVVVIVEACSTSFIDNVLIPIATTIILWIGLIS